ncbi:hypothetical protein V6Z11_D03G157500 [Gossypium hirsutum]
MSLLHTGKTKINKWHSSIKVKASSHGGPTKAKKHKNRKDFNLCYSDSGISIRHRYGKIFPSFTYLEDPWKSIPISMSVGIGYLKKNEQFKQHSFQWGMF